MIIRECLKSCVAFFWVMWEGEIRAVAKNTHSYYMLSHPIRESLLYYSFNFSYERGYLKLEIILRIIRENSNQTRSILKSRV